MNNPAPLWIGIGISIFVIDVGFWFFDKFVKAVGNLPVPGSEQRIREEE